MQVQLCSSKQVAAYLKVNSTPSDKHERTYHRIYADKRASGSLHMILRCQKQRRKW